jgi:hypothetical protein
MIRAPKLAGESPANKGSYTEDDFKAQIHALQELSKVEPETVFGLQLKDRIYIFPSTDSLPKEFFAPLVANNIFYLSCSFPRIKDVLAWYAVSDKFIAVQHCNPQQVIDYTGFKERGLLEFARKNIQSIFISYHIPSLINLFKSKPETQNLQITVVPSNESNGSLRELLGWKDTLYNPLAKTYSIKSINDAVDLFKVPEGALLEVK